MTKEPEKKKISRHAEPDTLGYTHIAIVDVYRAKSNINILGQDISHCH